jgi:hypothetical protein
VRGRSSGARGGRSTPNRDSSGGHSRTLAHTGNLYKDHDEAAQWQAGVLEDLQVHNPTLAHKDVLFLDRDRCRLDRALSC